ncbi:alcohol acyltransferase 9-like [Zingiber officinale]|uniref:Omega-hydroxypalmitate O-feruloyl transferase n=1 Tax=Zingiber officinale TaxID=94328 RepID=A0A8J5FJL4_ZINOF|nr:alcohol acyltransferase 9-like [Zingiber officinale]KAG6485578.1 hypothetical protein ZIOFF_054138 [Zingiber officinale]
MEVPDCYYIKPPLLVRPCNPTPCHSLYLSNLDDQPFLRFSIKYLYVYRRSVPGAALAASLAKALVEYYPLAGRLVRSSAGEKLEIECNAQGAVLAEAYAEFTADEFLRASARPHQSWRKLLYRQTAESFLDVPPLVVQVTHLSCGGMVLCTAFNHCICDAVGTAQFLHAWALLTAKPSGGVLPVAAFHGRGLLKPREPQRIDFPHSEFTRPEQEHDDLAQFLLSQPLSPVSITFTAAQILHLKKQCVPLLKCTSFEALAWHVWRSWVRALDPPPALRVKLLFSVNVRRRLTPELPAGYYGNAFVLACAETSAAELAASGASLGVRLVQAAKDAVDDDHVRSVVDLLEQRRAQPDLSASLVISPWTKLGLEEVDFGDGRPAHMGPVASEIYCLFLPVVGDLNAFTMLVSVPQGVADKFRHYCTINDSNEK